jgi:hypothetical protein
MARYASGKNAYAISDRSGLRFRYKDMVKEWNGSLVAKEEYEPKQPQLGPFRKAIDPQALRNPRPPTNLAAQRNIQYGFDPVGFRGNEDLTPNPLRGTGGVGEVTVTTS